MPACVGRTPTFALQDFSVLEERFSGVTWVGRPASGGQATGIAGSSSRESGGGRQATPMGNAPPLPGWRCMMAAARREPIVPDVARNLR